MNKVPARRVPGDTLPAFDALYLWKQEDVDSTLAFTRYRLEVVRSWPDSEVKHKLLAAIESSLRKKRNQPQETANSVVFTVWGGGLHNDGG